MGYLLAQSDTRSYYRDIRGYSIYVALEYLYDAFSEGKGNTTVTINSDNREY